MPYLPILYLLAAIWFLYIQVQAFRRAKASQSWPRVKGSVKYAQRQLLSIDDYANLTGAKIIYEYRVRKAKYTAQTVAFSPKFTGVRKLMMNYKPGKQVAVYYNPDNPEIAALETGPSSANYIMLLTSGIFLLLTILNLFYQIV